MSSDNELSKLCSWTASYISDSHRLKYLRYMIESLIENNVNEIYIAIYIETEKVSSDDIRQFNEYVSNYQNIHIIDLSKRHMQFESLKLINDTFSDIIKQKNITHILFMDDDDMLLDISEFNSQYDVLYGFQYFNRNEIDVDYRYADIKLSDIKNNRSEIDFSGYIVNINIVNEYFDTYTKNNEKISEIDVIIISHRNIMMDVEFTSYLYETYKPVHKTIVFRRSHIFHTRDWFNELNLCIKKEIEKIHRDCGADL